MGFVVEDQDRPCPTCGVWPGQKHDHEVHRIERQKERQMREGLAQLREQVERKPRDPREILEKWKSDLEAKGE